jgi:SAM-dependent methyltransferase
MKKDMIGYYAKRAREYEHIYAKPERQADIRRLRDRCAEAFRDQYVLEVSCGTGYWTQAFAPTARTVLACDINPEVLAVARSKDWTGAAAEFIEADSYALPDFEREFSAGFSGFWWSHIPKKRIRSFLDGFHAKLGRGALVTFMDNRYVEGSSTPIFRTDAQGDSFQQRRLGDGSLHEVLKNFPSREELLAAVSIFAEDAEVTIMDYFWILSYRLK